MKSERSTMGWFDEKEAKKGWTEKDFRWVASDMVDKNKKKHEDDLKELDKLNDPEKKRGWW